MVSHIRGRYDCIPLYYCNVGICIRSCTHSWFMRPIVSVLKWTSWNETIMLPDADLSDPDVEDCLDDKIILDPLALHDIDYSNDSYTDLMLLY